MKQVILIAIMLFTCSVCLKAASNPAEKEGKWVTIFNGKNLDGWTPKVTGYQSGENPLDNFRIEDGMMRVDYSKFAAFNGRFGHIFYKEKLSSFILHLEYRFVGELLPDAPSYCIRNSGVMVCSQSPESMDITENWPVSTEIQLLGCTDKLKQTTGNICTPGTTISVKGTPTTGHCINANSKYFYNNEWVNLDIVVHSGKEIINIVNGDTVLVTSEPRIGGMLLPENYPLPEGTLLKDGYIALQAEGQPIDFRNIKLKILDDKHETNKKTDTPPKAIGLKVIDNFDNYTSNELLSKAWYKPWHGAPNTRTLDPTVKAGGKYGLKCEYTTTKSDDAFYVPFCRVDKWDLSGCNGVQFWFKPDGSGREMTFQLNIANKDGNNIHDLWEYTYLTEKGNTDGRWVTIPFSSLKHNIKYADAPDVSPTFKPEAVIEAAIYIGGRNDEPGSGTVYFDEISGAKLQF